MHTQNSDRIEMCNIFKAIIIIIAVLLIYQSLHKPTTIVVRINEPKFSLLGPYNTTEYEVNDVYDQLIDIKNFSFTINPQPCEGYSSLLLMVIVSSDPRNYAKRSVIRNTWGRPLDSTKIVFLIGQSNNANVTRNIENETEMYGDIVQGKFNDAYRNMTYKHVMGLKWVAHHCPMARYVLKTDDDVVVNSHGLRQFLARELSPWGAEGLLTCQVVYHAVVQRDKAYKWKVTPAEYAGKYYPTYCPGWAILYSQDVVPKLLATAQTIPYFWIDDVHITGVVAEKIGVARTPLSSLILSARRVRTLTSLGPEYAGQFLFGPPDLSMDKVSQIWKAIPE